jgi:hypothetical protein
MTGLSLTGECMAKPSDQWERVIESVRIALFYEIELSLEIIVHSNSSIEKNQTLFEILYLQDK